MPNTNETKILKLGQRKIQVEWKENARGKVNVCSFSYEVRVEILKSEKQRNLIDSSFYYTR